MVNCNLFILGVPKAGTTSIYHWLNSSGEVSMSKIKEPRYHCDFAKKDFEGPGIDDFFDDYVVNHEQYAGLFASDTSFKIHGEASTDYFSSTTAAKNIKLAGYKNCKFIIILRNPVERAFSEYSHTVRDGLEENTFVESLKLEQNGFRNRYQPLFHHIRRGTYSESLNFYFEKFDRHDFFLMTYEDLKQNPQKSMDSICSFLEIGKVKIDSNEKHNESGVARLKFLHNLESPNHYLHDFIKFLFPKAFISYFKFRVHKLNLRKVYMTRDEWNYAYNIFKEDIEKLELLLDKDLAHWKIYSGE